MDRDEPGRRPAAAADGPAPWLDPALYDTIAAAVAPHLRARMAARGMHRPDEAEDRDVLTDAAAADVVDALWVAGLLVTGDADDRARLRQSWAAMSLALHLLSKHEPLTPDVLAAVPMSHSFYLMGHEAAHRQLALTWERLTGARTRVERFLHRAVPPSPAELGALLATLGGVDPATAEPADPVGDWPTRRAAAASWDTTDPDGSLRVPGGRIAGGGRAERPSPVAVVVDEATLQRQIDEQAMRLLGAALGIVDRDGAPTVRWDKVEGFAHLATSGARAYALRWPAGTRAVYDPVNGVTFAGDGPDAQVTARTLFVAFGSGDDADRFPVGTVRRLTARDKSRPGSWQCRHCGLGAAGAASVLAEKAECVGHEAICGDQDRRVDASVPRSAAPSPGPAGWPDADGEHRRAHRFDAGCRFCGARHGNLQQDLAHEQDCERRPHAQVFDVSSITMSVALLPYAAGNPTRIEAVATPRVVADVEDVDGDPAGRADHDWPVDGDLLIGGGLDVWLVVAWAHFYGGEKPHWWVLAVRLPDVDPADADLALIGGRDRADAWRTEHNVRADGAGRQHIPGKPR